MDASKGKQIVVFLDYDGTLSPIVDDPDRAFMTSEVRRLVQVDHCSPKTLVKSTKYLFIHT